MRVKFALAVLLFTGIACPIGKAQTIVPCATGTAGVLNNVTPKKHVPNRTPVPYPNVREADIMWEKWIWRTIDMREKMNQPFYYPFEPTNNRVNLFTTIQCGIADGRLNVYDPNAGDDFGVPMSSEAALAIGSRVDTLWVPDLNNPDSLVMTIVPTKLDPRNVLEYHMKEIWFFDRQRSVMEVRIVGICPVLYVYDKDGEFKGKMEMYWVYFPELRTVMVNSPFYNRFNDAGILNYDDVFMKRIFSSYSYKESNVYDRKISDYKAGMDALIEADRIKGDIMNMEQDLWDY